MKLLSFLRDGRETWGCVLGSGVVDLGSRLTEYPTLADYIGSGAYLNASTAIKGMVADLPLEEVQFLPVIPRPEKIICVARNYHDHYQEVVNAGGKIELHEKPPVFFRYWRSQAAHNQPIIRPRASETLDWEGELAVIIGKQGRDIPVEKALEHVAGYSCYNEASVREWQFHAKQISPGKNFESTGGFGPWMVTSDEVAPEKGLKIETRLNDETVQSSNTKLMIFNVAQIINYASTIFTLVPGDVLAMGTPAGVGWTQNPPRFMKEGDVCEVEIEGIGILRNQIENQR